MIDLLPGKHTRLNETAFGIGAVILNQLDQAKSLDQLWTELKDLRTRKRIMPERVTLEDVIAVLHLLFAMRTIFVTEAGELMRCG